FPEDRSTDVEPGLEFGFGADDASDRNPTGGDFSHELPRDSLGQLLRSSGGGNDQPRGAAALYRILSRGQQPVTYRVQMREAAMLGEHRVSRDDGLGDAFVGPVGCVAEIRGGFPDRWARNARVTGRELHENIDEDADDPVAADLAQEVVQWVAAVGCQLPGRPFFDQSLAKSLNVVLGEVLGGQASGQRLEKASNRE